MNVDLHCHSTASDGALAPAVLVARAFENALAGKLSFGELARELRQYTPQGVTQGSLFVPENYLTLPILQ